MPWISYRTTVFKNYKSSWMWPTFTRYTMTWIKWEPSQTCCTKCLTFNYSRLHVTRTSLGWLPNHPLCYLDTWKYWVGKQQRGHGTQYLAGIKVLIFCGKGVDSLILVWYLNATCSSLNCFACFKRNRSCSIRTFTSSVIRPVIHKKWFSQFSRKSSQV